MITYLLRIYEVLIIKVICTIIEKDSVFVQITVLF